MIKPSSFCYLDYDLKIRFLYNFWHYSNKLKIKCIRNNKNEYVFVTSIFIICFFWMSFRDSFTRNTSGKENLQYDDIAFHHFFITLLLVIFLPLLYTVIRTIINPFRHLPNLKDIEEKRQFQSKIKRFKKDNKFSYVTVGFVFKVFISPYQRLSS